MIRTEVYDGFQSIAERRTAMLLTHAAGGTIEVKESDILDLPYLRVEWVKDVRTGRTIIKTVDVRKVKREEAMG